MTPLSGNKKARETLVFLFATIPGVGVAIYRMA